MLLSNKPLEPSPGSAHTTQQTQEDVKSNNTAGCNESKTFSFKTRKSSSERTIRDTHNKKTETWQNNGIWVMAPSFVTQYWWCPIYRCSTPLTLKLVQSETNRKQKSSATSQTWTQLFLSGKSTTFAPFASVTSAVRGNITLGVAVGPHQCVTDQLLAKGDAIWALHETRAAV